MQSEPRHQTNSANEHRNIAPGKVCVLERGTRWCKTAQTICPHEINSIGSLRMFCTQFLPLCGALRASLFSCYGPNAGQMVTFSFAILFLSHLCSQTSQTICTRSIPTFVLLQSWAMKLLQQSHEFRMAPTGGQMTSHGSWLNAPGAKIRHKEGPHLNHTLWPPE